MLRVDTNSAGIRFVNVDTTSPEGIERARSLDLLGSRYTDFVVVSNLHGATRLFDSPGYRGRIFALFRHPVKTASSMYYWLRETQRDVSSLTLLQYASSDQAGVDNPLVRALTGEDRYEGLGTSHLGHSREVLRRYVLVGLPEFMDASLVRFEQYFGWWDGVADDVGRLRCQADLIMKGDTRGEHKSPDPGTPEYKALAVLHWADLELYHFAKELFEQQAALIP